MNGLILQLASLTGRPRSAALGDCIACGSVVRECDDRMRIHGRYAHTRCATYRLRRVATRRDLGARERDAAFTGD